MRAHREFGKLRAGRKADRQMDHGGRVERRLCGEQSAQNAEYNATCGHTSVAGDMLVSRKVRAVKGAKQGGTAGYLLVLDIHCQGRFFFPDLQGA